MADKIERIERRAIKAGVKASKKRHHLLTEEELRELKIQIMPAGLRAGLFLLGCALFTLAVTGWPASDIAKILEAILGALLMLCGIFGVRRTLGRMADTFDGADIIGDVVSGIADIFN